MKRFFKTEKAVKKEKKPPHGPLYPLEEAEAFFPGFISTLLLFLKGFSIDAKELNTEEFRAGAALLARRLKTAKRVKDVKTLFEKKQNMMALFIKKQNWYLAKKETEYKDMIDLLTHAMAKINVENDEFSQKMMEQSSKIEKVTSLSDIKQIKDALRNAIEEMRKKVREKQARDGKHMAHLARTVKALSAELEKAEKGSMRDELTGVYNMSAFKHYITEVLENNSPDNGPLAMVSLDIDQFHKITELYGNKIGDRVLLAVADKCREFLKSGDFAARYDGGLFVMLLSGETLRRIVKRAKQFCGSIEKSNYALDGGTDHAFSFTVSLGITPSLKNDTPETMIRRSLGALKSARDAGGNRVRIEKG